MKAAYFSLINDNYHGFEYKKTLEESDLRRSFFALITDDVESFYLKYQRILHKIKGIILIPGKTIIIEKPFNNLRVICFTQAMSAELFSFAQMYLDTLEESINLKSSLDLLKIESDRTLIQYKRLQGFYESVQEKTRQDIQNQNKWTIGALLKLIEFRNTDLLNAGVEDYFKTVLSFFSNNYFDFNGVALMRNCKIKPEVVLAIGDVSEAVKEKTGCKNEICWTSVTPMNIDNKTENLLIVAKSRDYYFKEYEKSFFLLFSEIIVAAYNEKLNEKALIVARDEAQSANRMKTQFMANMSHELRNPLNGIIGMIGLLKSSGLNPIQLQQISLLEYSSRSLAVIINDLLDFSGIEKGKFKLSKEAFNPRELLEKSIDVFELPAKDKGLRLEFNNKLEKEYCLQGDPNRLQQIIINFISNSIKYSDHGKITLQIELIKENINDVICRFSVSDTGIGIPDNKIETIFTEFVQLEDTYTKSHKGLGLGLAIVKSLVEMMNGKIEVKSKVGIGSTFCVDIPFKKLPIESEIASISDQKPSKPQRNLKIIIAEDELINLVYLDQVFTKEGHTVGKARNGKEVLQLLATESYDLICMDIGMPEMNGLECIKKIREQNISTPAFALSGYNTEADKNNFIKAGFSSVFSKPVDIQEIIHAINLIY